MGTAFMYRRCIVCFALTAGDRLRCKHSCRMPRMTPRRPTPRPPKRQQAKRSPKARHSSTRKKFWRRAKRHSRKATSQRPSKAFDQLARAGESAEFTGSVPIADSLATLAAAQALAGMKEYDSALEDFKLAIDLQENFVPALFARGQMFLDIENPDNFPTALADFQKAIKTERDNLTAQFGFGKAAVLTGNYQAGIGPLTRVIEAQPENAEAYRLRGIAIHEHLQAQRGRRRLAEGDQPQPE